MNKPTAKFIVVAIVFSSLLFAGQDQALAQKPPERTPSAAGGTGPFQVTLYLENDYVKPFATWTLAPGMRMLKIPEIAQTPRSISLGSQVGAIIFPNRDYSSSTYVMWTYKQTLEGTANVKHSLIPYERYRGSAPSINQRLMSGDGCSLVLYRLDIPDFLGIYLEADRPIQQNGRFFSLPDRASETTSFYDKIPEGGPWVLSFVPGGSGGMSLYPSVSPPNPNNIEIMIKTPNGLNLKLPEPNSQAPRHNLRSLGVDRLISSLMIRNVGPVNEQTYHEPVRVRAPAVSTIPPGVLIQIGGAWQSPVGTYEFVQEGKAFTFENSQLKQQGYGSFDGLSIVASWAGPGIGINRITGWIAEIDPQGVALRMEWEGGAAFTRLAPPAVVVSGTWNSSIGALYDFRQSGNSFTWSAPSLGQEGSGSISGKDILTQWVGKSGSGSAKGRITQIDAKGGAVRIEWDNGVSFFRPEPAAVLKSPDIQVLPLQPRAVDVSGTWKGPLGMTYQFTQNGAQFTWVVGATGEKGSGSLDGMEVAAKWSSLLGSGSANGKITAVDASGRAIRIEWNNGVVFSR